MIVLVFGLPASGKSWFARQFAEKLKASYLNTDMIRVQLGKTGQYDKDSKQEIYDELKNLAIRNLKNKKDIIIDGTFHKKERREDFFNLADENNTQIYLVEIKASESKVRERLKKRKGYSEADFEVYRQLKSEFEFPETDYLVLYNEDGNINKLIDETMAYIKKKGKYG
ncbi:MAG: AAA family ATPase [Bacteroidota bacterium]